MEALEGVRLVYGRDALLKCLRLKPETALDIGSGDGEQAGIMRQAGIDVTTISLSPPADHVIDFMEFDGGKYDLVWACHVLEHTANPGLFIEKCREHINPDGYLAVTVPPRKDDLVGGHLTLWTIGLLAYHLVLAGFDCKWGKSYGYNLSIIAAPTDIPIACLDGKGLAQLSERFPVPVHQDIDGRLPDWNHL